MTTDWWLTIPTGRGTACWQLGPVDDITREELITRARTLLDVPVADGVHLHGGQPHETFLAQCTIRPRAELDAVDPAAVAGYRTRVDQATSTARRDAAKAALQRCTPDERAQVIGEIPPRTTGSIRSS